MANETDGIGHPLAWDSLLGPGCAIAKPAITPEVSLPDVSLPTDPNIEQAAIGAALIEPDQVMPYYLKKNLQASDFQNPEMRKLFVALISLYRAKKPIDTLILAQETGVDVAVINATFDCCPTWIHAEYYADLILNESRKRQLFEMGTRITEQKSDISVPDCIADIRKTLDSFESGTAVVYRSLTDFAQSEIDEGQTLLGNRFLCRGGGMLFVGPSGVGKSSASVQQDILWALGLPAFGIMPARPLKIVCIQAENDDGDLTEMAQGVMNGLHLTDEDRLIVHENTCYIEENAKTGTFLINFVESVLRSIKPDIIRLDPLQSYLGGDVSDAAVMSDFVNTGFKPLMKKYNCACIINHHTPKTQNRDTSKWKHSDFQYAGAGSAVLTNWARAIIIVDSLKDNPDTFKFIAAKRGWRVDWRDENEEKTIFQYFRHSREHGVIFWEDASAEEVAMTMNVPKTMFDLLDLVPVLEPIPKDELIMKAKTVDIGQNKARKFINELLVTKSLFEWKQAGISRGKVGLAKVQQPEQVLDV